MTLCKVCKVVLLCAAAAIPSQSQVLTTLVTFNGTNANPTSGALIQGKDGNFYGTTDVRGQYGVITQSGTAFKMTPGGALTTLHTFGGTPADGTYIESGLMQASDGNFYGTAGAGGANTAGTIYKITPAGSYTTLYNFCSQPLCPDGDDPIAPLMQASDGNFYGTTWAGGTINAGSVFKITPGGTLTTLYSFCTVVMGGLCADGAGPLTGLMQASDGNLYGSTSTGGNQNAGTIFRITLGGAFTMMHNFSFAKGNLPPTANFMDPGPPAASQFVQGADGNLYGTTVYGGANQDGQIFKMALDGTFTTVFSFAWGQPGGMASPNGLILASDGNFYGTASFGGTSLFSIDLGNGAIFRMTPSGTVTILHIFGITDGSVPTAALVQGTDGNLYGTTAGNFIDVVVPGEATLGTAFKLSLQPVEPLCTPPLITSVDSAASYGGYSYFTSGSWLEIMGEGLTNPANPPSQWTASDFVGLNAPTMRQGNSVSINGKPAYVWYISPAQLNVQAPEDAATGNVPITVTNYCGATSPPFMFPRQALAPGFLAPSSFSAGTTQYMVATFASDGAYVLNTSFGATLGVASRPAKPGDLIIAYGIGFGDVTPTILPGVMAEQSSTLVAPITVSFGSTPVPSLLYSGLAGGFVGLYEFYITVPSGLANGDYQINVTQNGTKVPQSLYLSVHN
jgi:uncharacterized protein (TIGR03437 family)